METATKDKRDAWSQEPKVHNWFAIENEAEFRRFEWERAAAQEARAAQVMAQSRPRWLRMPTLSLPGLKLKRPATPGLAFTAPHQAAICETSPSV